MKKTSQFLPLLKQMLGLYRYGQIPLLLWFLSCGIVFYFGLIVLPVAWMHGHNGGSVGEANFLSIVILWGFLMMVATPLPFQLLGGLTSLEFIFTRAVDRAVWLRAERAAVAVIALGPLILNLALLPWQPPLAIEPAAANSPGVKIQERYLAIFPGSHLEPASKSSAKEEQLIIHHGNAMFAAWLLWTGLSLICLVAAYFSIVFTAWQRAGWHHSKSKHRTWLGAVIVNAPAFAPIFLIIICLLARFNIFEESFLLFASHPVLWALGLAALIAVVQPMAERNIKKMEFDFV